MEDYLVKGEDGKVRCFFNIDDKDYRKYHDTEFGRPTKDDRRIFEKICIEGFVSGLSFITLLKKRENFRKAFDNFDYQKIAEYDDEKLKSLMKDKGLIRNEKKLKSVINNAKQMPEIMDEFGSLAAFVWSFKPDEKDRPEKMDLKALENMTKTEESTAFAKALKKRGWSYVGPTNMYAVLQSVGVVNDHFDGCFCREECFEDMNNFKLP